LVAVVFPVVEEVVVELAEEILPIGIVISME